MQERTIALDRARTFCTILVVAYHAALPFTRVEHHDGWLGFDLFVLFNDSFFMALMFFLSGLFVWPSLARKGIAAFLRDRAVRLGIPFILSVIVLMPIANYPEALNANPELGFFTYWATTLLHGPHPAGPAWFVWVLLAFDALAVMLYRTAPAILAPINRLSKWAHVRPSYFFVPLVLASCAAYVPLLMAFPESRWFEIGPFAVQATRPLLYAVYFFAGAGIGAANMERGLLAERGPLVRQWAAWCVAALGAFCAVVLVTALRHALWPVPANPPAWWSALDGMTTSVFCATVSFALLAVFLRFRDSGLAVLDRLRGSAYGVYLCHFVVILWLKVALVHTQLNVASKAAIMFAAALLLSWSVVSVLRRSRLVARIV